MSAKFREKVGKDLRRIVNEKCENLPHKNSGTQTCYAHSQQSLLIVWGCSTHYNKSAYSHHHLTTSTLQWNVVVLHG